MKVYVLTVGEYHYTRVHGVFSTELKANESGVALGDSFDVYPFEIDADSTPAGMKSFNVWLNEAGVIITIENKPMDRPAGELQIGELRQSGQAKYYFSCWARDEEDARGIATKRVAKETAAA